jgi:rubredoxin
MYECGLCAYVYDETTGEPDGDIEPGTKWDDLPESYICPVCGAGKENFNAV